VSIGIPAYCNSAIPKQRVAAEKAAQAVLDVRREFPNATRADLYDPLTMPPLPAKAHTALDRAVDRWLPD
jgi:hypothetical protein